MRSKQIWGSVRWSQPPTDWGVYRSVTRKIYGTSVQHKLLKIQTCLNGTEPPNRPKVWAMFVPLNHPLPLSLSLFIFFHKYLSSFHHTYVYIYTHNIYIVFIFLYLYVIYIYAVTNICICFSHFPPKPNRPQLWVNFSESDPIPSFQAFPSRASCCLCSSSEPEDFAKKPLEALWFRWNFFSIFLLGLDVMMSHKRSIMAKKTATSECPKTVHPLRLETNPSIKSRLERWLNRTEWVHARIKGAEFSVLWWFDASTWA